MWLNRIFIVLPKGPRIWATSQRVLLTFGYKRDCHDVNCALGDQLKSLTSSFPDNTGTMHRSLSPSSCMQRALLWDVPLSPHPVGSRTTPHHTRPLGVVTRRKGHEGKRFKGAITIHLLSFLPTDLVYLSPFLSFLLPLSFFLLPPSSPCSPVLKRVCSRQQSVCQRNKQKPVWPSCRRFLCSPQNRSQKK